MVSRHRLLFMSITAAAVMANGTVWAGEAIERPENPPQQDRSRQPITAVPSWASDLDAKATAQFSWDKFHAEPPPDTARGAVVPPTCPENEHYSGVSHTCEPKPQF